VCNTHRSPKEIVNSTYYVVGRGPKALTFAHPVLALEYAETLRPDLGLEVTQVFLRYRAADISLANDILDRNDLLVRVSDLRPCRLKRGPPVHATASMPTSHCGLSPA
jgi:hypothetical protein